MPVHPRATRNALLTCAWLLGCLLACDPARARAPSTHPPTADHRPRAIDAEATAMLAHAPADTPYVWFNAEPLPSAYLRRIGPVVEATLAIWAQELDRAPTPDDPQTRVIVDTFRGRLDPAGLRALGLNTNPRMLVYGLGLAPVARIELRDGAVVRRVLSDIDLGDGHRDAREVAGHFVWSSGDEWDPVALTVAVVDNQLVVALHPPGVQQAIERHMIAPSPRGPAAAQWLATASRRHGLEHHGVGMIDLARITAILGGEGGGLTRAVMRAWDASMAGDPCLAHLRSRIARAPRVWFGLRDVSERGISAAVIWDLDEGLRTELRGIATPIPGLGRSHRDEGLASIGLGVDVGAAWLLARRWFGGDRTTACLDLFDDDAEYDELGWTAAVQGASAVLHGWDPARETISFAMVLGVSDPLAWLAAEVPDVDRSALRRNGRVVPLSRVMSAPLGPPWRDGWVARERHALGIAAGDGARKNLRRSISKRRRDSSTLASWTIDVRAMLDTIPARAMQRALAEFDEVERAWAKAVLDLMGRWQSRVVVSDHGLEFESALEIR